MIPFPFNENPFLFFVVDHLLVGQLCINTKSNRSLTIVSESDTMFNKWNRRCATVQLMLSTDPSYDNRTIASTLKMQIWIAMNNRDVPRVMKTKFPATVMVLVWFQVRATSCHLTSLKSAWKSTPKCTWMCWECGDPLMQSDGLWQTLGVAAGLGAGPQVKRDPGLASERVLRLCTLLSLAPPPPPTWIHWTTSFSHMSRTSPTWPPTIPKPARSPPYAEYSSSSPAGTCEKGMLPVPDPYEVGNWSWRQLHWIDVSSTTLIKLPELIFSIKVLK